MPRLRVVIKKSGTIWKVIGAKSWIGINLFFQKRIVFVKYSIYFFLLEEYHYEDNSEKFNNTFQNFRVVQFSIMFGSLSESSKVKLLIKRQIWLKDIFPHIECFFWVKYYCKFEITIRFYSTEGRYAPGVCEVWATNTVDVNIGNDVGEREGEVA